MSRVILAFMPALSCVCVCVCRACVRVTQVAMMREAVLNGTRQGVVLPDSVFILSTWDEPRCVPNTHTRTRTHTHAELAFPQYKALGHAQREGKCLYACLSVCACVCVHRCPVKTPSRCPAPVLSLVKSWMPHTNTSDHTDILVPFFNHVYQV